MTHRTQNLQSINCKVGPDQNNAPHKKLAVFSVI